MKRDSEEGVSAWLYLVIVGAVYMIICLLMKHPGWIVSVLTQNTASDLTGETPRMLAAAYFDRMVFDTALQAGEREQIALALSEAVISEAPAAFVFGCIDSFVVRGINREGISGKVVCFFAGYVLQALVAVSCVEPVTWTDAIQKAFNPIIWIWMVGGTIYFIYRSILGDSDVGGITDRVASVMMSILFAAFKEMMKLLFLIMIFSESSYCIHMVAQQFGMGQWITASAVLITSYYILLNRCADRIADVASDKFMRLMEVGSGGYQKTVAGDVFCVVASLIILASAVILSVGAG